MKIGIITLHKVPNYGSALQAYALQHYLQQTFHCKVELIDYIYPNKFHFKGETFLKRIKRYGRNIINYFNNTKRQKKKAFQDFYNEYFQLSNYRYNSIESIYNNPPNYDIYITGSDQVWNPMTLKNDPVMYCTFASSQKKRIAFGASFTTKSLSVQDAVKIKKWLSNYSYIGVRESSSLNILQQLELNPKIIQECTCDPTLLLKSSEYDQIAKKSKMQIKEDFVLVYSLGYAFLPEPAISIITNLISKQFHYKTIFIGDYPIKYKCDTIIHNNIGPCEFVYLFKQAKFIITSSFHGTMFSIIYRKPFISILPKETQKDYRIRDVLFTLNLQQCGIECDNRHPQICFTNPFTKDVENRIELYVNKSERFLELALKQSI